MRPRQDTLIAAFLVLLATSFVNMAVGALMISTFDPLMMAGGGALIGLSVALLVGDWVRV